MPIRPSEGLSHQHGESGAVSLSPCSPALGLREGRSGWMVGPPRGMGHPTFRSEDGGRHSSGQPGGLSTELGLWSHAWACAAHFASGK